MNWTEPQYCGNPGILTMKESIDILGTELNWRLYVSNLQEKTWLVSLVQKPKSLFHLYGFNGSSHKTFPRFQDPCHTVLCMEPRLCGCSEMGDQIQRDKKCGAKLLSWMKDQVMLWRVAEITWATDHNFLGISWLPSCWHWESAGVWPLVSLFFDSGGGIRFLRYLLICSHNSYMPVNCHPGSHLCRPQGSCHC